MMPKVRICNQIETNTVMVIVVMLLRLSRCDAEPLSLLHSLYFKNLSDQKNLVERKTYNKLFI